MRLYLDRTEYYNEVCEVIRLFLPLSAVELIDAASVSDSDKTGKADNTGITGKADNTGIAGKADNSGNAEKTGQTLNAGKIGNTEKAGIAYNAVNADNTEKTGNVHNAVNADNAEKNGKADNSSDGVLKVVIRTSQEGFYCNAELHINSEIYSYDHSLPFMGTDKLIVKRYEKRCMKIAVFRALRKAFPRKHVPWGSLTGIRPTSLLRELKNTLGETEARRMMLEEFDVTKAKYALADRICNVQKKIFSAIPENSVDIYIGIPFCRTRCLYCSFASGLRTKKTDMASYIAALKRDIRGGAELVKELDLHVRALYMGGGTPTVLTADELKDVLEFTLSAYGISKDDKNIEFTVEAGRPDTITPEKLKILADCGITRISINPQTMNDETLRLVGRDHTAADIRECFYLARSLGFDSINMDLIAGLPGENAEIMKHSIDEIIKLDPDCLTVHSLAIKRSSRLHEHLEDYDLPDVSEVEKMIALGAEGAEKLGMEPYYMYRQKYMAGNLENVGYSKPGKICLYNIDMMEDSLSIISHGAGAMNKRIFGAKGRIERIPNPKDIKTYIAKLDIIKQKRFDLFSQE